MLDLITSYLIQNKEGALASLGAFQIKNNKAEIDHVKELILPPEEEVIFREQLGLASEGLVNYIAVNKNLSHQDAEAQLDAFCKTAKAGINEGGRLELNSFGSLQKNSAGNIYFTRHNSYDYFQPVPAIKLAHEPSPGLDSGEMETTTTSIIDYMSESEPGIKDRWVLWAIILTVISIVVLIYHFWM